MTPTTNCCGELCGTSQICELLHQGFPFKSFCKRLKFPIISLKQEAWWDGGGDIKKLGDAHYLFVY